jgi:hypothetical protein
VPRNIPSGILTGLEGNELSTRMLLEVRLNYDDVAAAGNALSIIEGQYQSVGMNIVVENNYVVFRFVANDTDNLIIPDTCIDSNYANRIYFAADITRGSIDTSIDGQVEKCNVKISNKWQLWAAVFANCGNIMNNRPCVLLQYFLDYPNEAPIVLFSGVMNNIQMTASQFGWDIKRSVVDFNEDGPNYTYDVGCQWVFKSFRCGYTGSETTCDRTLTRCLALQNVINFGGHPSVPREMVVK